MCRFALSVLMSLFVFVVHAHAQKTLPIEHAPGLFRITRLGKDVIDLSSASGNHTAELRDLDICEAGGKKLTAEEFRKRVKLGSVVVVAPTDNKIDPSYLKLFKEDTLVLAGVTVILARADKLGRGWTMDMKLLKANDTPLEGKILGANFRPEDVKLQNTGLNLRSGNDRIHIFLRLKAGQGIEGRSFIFDAEEPGNARPAVHVHIHSTRPLGVATYSAGYAMRLEFGKEKDGSIPAQLYLCLPDAQKSWIAGSFSLKLE